MSLRSKLFQYAHADRVAAFGAFPGPAPPFPFGHQAALWSGPPWESAQRLADAHRDLALLWMRDIPVLFVGGPELAERILRDENGLFEPVPVANLIGTGRLGGLRAKRDLVCHGTTVFAGPSPLSLPAQSWTLEWMEQQLPGLKSYFSERARAFARESMGSSLPLHASLLRVVFSALSRMILGQELSHQAFEDFLEWTLGADRAALGFEKAEKSMHLHDDAGSRLLQAIATRIAEARRYPEDNRTDLIGHLIHERCPLAEDLWAPALRNLLMANCQPIAAGLTSTMHLLTQHASELQNLELELVQSDADPSLTDLRRLPQLDAIYKESQRIAPPIPLVARRFRGTTQADWEGYPVPPQTGLVINLAALHRHPEHWKEPNEFRPNRWLSHQKSDAARAFLPGAKGEFADTSQRVNEVLTKQLLFSWLREHTIKAGEGRAQGHRDRLIQGVRIPHLVEARLYQRRPQPATESDRSNLLSAGMDGSGPAVESMTTARQRPSHVLPVTPRRR